jgi:hypothetical protein
MYASGDSPEPKWLEDHHVESRWWEQLNETMVAWGREVDRLEYGRVKYGIDGVGIVVDDDCMSGTTLDVAKYLILRPDCKLYSKWETKASLIF